MSIYEEVSNATSIIQTVSQQTLPIFSSLKIYGSVEHPLYAVNDIGYLLEVKNVDRLVKSYTPKECITAKIRTADGERQTKLLTRHGMYRIMFDADNPVSEVFREFVYIVLDKLTDNGEVKLKTVQSDMQQLYAAELDRATNYLQVRIQNLEHEIGTALQINRRVNEIMHNKEHEAGRLNQESQHLQMKIHNLEKQLLTAELNAEHDDDEQLLEYLKSKYLKKYLVYLLPTKDDEEYPYDYTENPDENDDMYYRITSRECKVGNLVKEIYFESDTQFIDLKNQLIKHAKPGDILLCSLYIIIETANDIRNRPIIEKSREKRATIEANLTALKSLWEKDV